MKLPSAAQKRCLLQAVDAPPGQDASTDQAAVVSQALAILHGVCSAPPGHGVAPPDSATRGGSSGRAGRVSGLAAWADLLVELIRRGKDALDRALSASDDAAGGAVQQVIKLSWASLDALSAVRAGWKADAFLAVRSRRKSSPALLVAGAQPVRLRQEVQWYKAARGHRTCTDANSGAGTGGEGAIHHRAEAEQGRAAR